MIAISTQLLGEESHSIIVIDFILLLNKRNALEKSIVY
jgi:hypothetical protein